MLSILAGLICPTAMGATALVVTWGATHESYGRVFGWRDDERRRK